MALLHVVKRRPKVAVAPDGQMPLMEHLRELRSRLIVSIVALVPGFVLGLVFFRQISNFLTAPICTIRIRGVLPDKDKCRDLLVIQDVLGPFNLMVKVALAAGFLLAAPVLLYQLWAFITPGLHRHERRWTIAFMSTAVPLFFAGAALAYLILPKALELLLSFTPENAANLIPYQNYLSLVVRLIVVFGLAFQAPVLVVMLNLAGLLPTAQLASWWRTIVLGVFVFAAVATPTGDPITMLVLATPLVLLILLAYFFCAAMDRRRARRPVDDLDYDALDDDETSALDTTPSPLDPGHHADGAPLADTAGATRMDD